MDELIEFNRQGASLSRDHRILDLRAYWDALARGGPVPLFVLLKSNGTPDQRSTQYLTADRVQHVVTSPLSEEFYEHAHGVDALIVKDLRRRHSVRP